MKSISSWHNAQVITLLPDGGLRFTPVVGRKLTEEEQTRNKEVLEQYEARKANFAPDQSIFPQAQAQSEE